MKNNNKINLRILSLIRCWSPSFPGLSGSMTFSGSKRWFLKQILNSLLLEIGYLFGDGILISLSSLLRAIFSSLSLSRLVRHSSSWDWSTRIEYYISY